MSEEKLNSFEYRPLPGAEVLPGFTAGNVYPILFVDRVPGHRRSVYTKNSQGQYVKVPIRSIQGSEAWWNKVQAHHFADECVFGIDRNRLIARVVHGAHLYGMERLNSDIDLKGVYVPDLWQCIWDSASQTYSFGTPSTWGKNDSEDIDYEVLSLPGFISLALMGDVKTFDMLHAPRDARIIKEGDYPFALEIWDFLVDNRKAFYSKEMVRKVLDYAYNQASRYGVKGSRYSLIKEVLSAIESNPDAKRVEDILVELPLLKDHLGQIVSYVHSPDKSSGKVYYHFLGKDFEDKSPVALMKDSLEKLEARYSNRVKQAAANENVDWKAMAHALRACYQLKPILESNGAEGFSYPLPQTDILIKVKNGELDFKTDVAPLFDEAIQQLESHLKVCTLPDSANSVFWYNWVTEKIKEVSEW